MREKTTLLLLLFKAGHHQDDADADADDVDDDHDEEAEGEGGIPINISNHITQGHLEERVSCSLPAS